MVSAIKGRANRFSAAFAEAVIIAVSGVALALLANAVSPRGLRLGTNYFPGGHVNDTALATAATNGTLSIHSGNFAATNPEALTVAKRLAAKGLILVQHDAALELHRDPGYADGRIVFIDARTDDAYQAGHIPGAIQFDHYRAPAYLPAVLPACMQAEQVVVYCGGGECEDSEFAAITLRDLGVPGDRISIYAGGIKDWTGARLPVEIGGRNSGVLQPPKP